MVDTDSSGTLETEEVRSYARCGRTFKRIYVEHNRVRLQTSCVVARLCFSVLPCTRGLRRVGRRVGRRAHVGRVLVRQRDAALEAEAHRAEPSVGHPLVGDLGEEELTADEVQPPAVAIGPG